MVPALGSDGTVTASNYALSPATVTVQAGEKVTFTNAQGAHNVVFSDGSFREPAQPSTSKWTVERTFDAPGTYQYYCAPHGTASGQGMAGKVVVTAAPATTTATTTTTTTTAAPAGAPPGAEPPTAEGAPPATAGSGADTRAPGLWGRLVRTVNPRAAIALRLGTTEAVTVEGRLRRVGAARVSLVRFELAEGRRTVRIRGTSAGRLRPGDFQLSLVAVDAAGNRSAPWSVRLQVA